MGESFNLVLNKVLDEIDELKGRLDDQEEDINTLADNQADSDDSEDD